MLIMLVRNRESNPSWRLSHVVKQVQTASTGGSSSCSIVVSSVLLSFFLSFFFVGIHAKTRQITSLVARRCHSGPLQLRTDYDRPTGAETHRVWRRRETTSRLNSTSGHDTLCPPTPRIESQVQLAPGKFNYVTRNTEGHVSCVHVWSSLWYTFTLRAFSHLSNLIYCLFNAIHDPWLSASWSVSFWRLAYTSVNTTLFCFRSSGSSSEAFLLRPHTHPLSFSCLHGGRSCITSWLVTD